MWERAGVISLHQQIGAFERGSAKIALHQRQRDDLDIGKLGTVVGLSPLALILLVLKKIIAEAIENYELRLYTIHGCCLQRSKMFGQTNFTSILAENTLFNSRLRLS